MHFPILLTTLTLTTLAKALPPSSKAFTLRATLLSSKDLTPPLETSYLTTQRTGAGTSISTLTSPSSSSSIPTWYQNNTNPASITTDIPNVYPLHLLLSDPSTPNEHAIGATVAGAGSPLQITSGGKLSTLAPGDIYVVCDRDLVLGGTKTSVRTARYVYAGETVPEDCAAVEFVAECAVLPDLPAGSSWDHDSVVEVPCSAAA